MLNFYSLLSTIQQRTNHKMVRSLLKNYLYIHFKVHLSHFIKILSVILSTQVLCFAQSENLFRTYVYNEPSHLDSHLLKTTSSNHLLSQLYRNLLRLNKDGELIPELASKCRQKGTLIECQLKSNIQWNNGTPITSEDFLRAYEFILTDPESLRPDLLFPIKNAEEIFQKKKVFSTIGIHVQKNKIIFQLKTENSDFIYHLANMILSPKAKDGQLYSGPYELETWNKGKNILLKPNHYFWHSKKRPRLEFKFINDDSIALNLYEKNQLDMVRRLPTFLIANMKTRKDYFEYPLTRFDFLAFNSKLQQNRNLRAAVAQGLDFPELQRLYSSKGLPGCASLPPRFFINEQTPCLRMDLKNAKIALSQVAKSELNNLTYGYSSLGGEDIRRSAEWIQIQMKKNLHLDIQPIGFENKIFLQKSMDGEFSLYHKGVPVEIPTCAEALKQSQIKDERTQKAISRLLKSRQKTAQQKICTETIKEILKDFRIIPTGHYDYSTLIRPGFDFEVNELNQLYF